MYTLAISFSPPLSSSSSFSNVVAECLLVQHFAMFDSWNKTFHVCARCFFFVIFHSFIHCTCTIHIHTHINRSHSRINVKRRKNIHRSVCLCHWNIHISTVNNNLNAVTAILSNRRKSEHIDFSNAHVQPLAEFTFTCNSTIFFYKLSYWIVEFCCCCCSDFWCCRCLPVYFLAVTK